MLSFTWLNNNNNNNNDDEDEDDRTDKSKGINKKDNKLKKNLEDKANKQKNVDDKQKSRHTLYTQNPRWREELEEALKNQDHSEYYQKIRSWLKNSIDSSILQKPVK